MKKIVCIVIAILAFALILFAFMQKSEKYPYLVNTNTISCIPVSSKMPINLSIYREYNAETVSVKVYPGKTAEDIKGKEPLAVFTKEFKNKSSSISAVRFVWDTPDQVGSYIAECYSSYYDGKNKIDCPDKLYIPFEVVVPCSEHTFTENANSVYGDKGITPDCYTKGTVYNLCSICGYEEMIETDYSHVYGNGVTVSSANCTDLGYRTYECTKCGITKVEIIENDSESHRIRAVEKVAATATRPGSVWFECDKCNYVEPYQTEIPALFMEIDPGLYYEVPVAWAYDNGILDTIKGYTFDPDKQCSNAIVISLMYIANGVGVTKEDINPFTDVSEGDYFRDAAKWAYKYGVVEGTEFRPNALCTRAMLVEYLWRMSGCPEAETTAEFTDVPADASYSKAVSWAVSKGIASGMDDGIFNPDWNCTEAQVVTFLYRVIGDEKAE